MSGETLADDVNSISLEQEYEELVLGCFSRYGFAAEDLQVEAIKVGRNFLRQRYVVLVALKCSDALAALQLAYIAPTVDRKAREVLTGKWFADFSELVGLWTRCTSEIHVSQELRAILQTGA